MGILLREVSHPLHLFDVGSQKQWKGTGGMPPIRTLSPPSKPCPHNNFQKIIGKTIACCS